MMFTVKFSNGMNEQYKMEDIQALVNYIKHEETEYFEGCANEQSIYIVNEYGTQYLLPWYWDIQAFGEVVEVF